MSGPPGPAAAAPVRRGRAPAKVNLGLAILGRRPDGYHELRSVFARLALADELSMVVGVDDGGGTHGAGGLLRPWPGTGGAPPADDLAHRATDALRSWAGRPLPRLALTIRKRIPVAAGLGGGSSDAAAALRLAVASWGLGVEERQLMTLGAALGSDVPFFVADCLLGLVEGRGERVRCLAEHSVAAGAWRAPPGLLLVCSPGKGSTAAVFAALAARGHREEPSAAAPVTDRLVQRLERGGGPEALLELAPELRDANDLWPAATHLMPHLPRLRADLEGFLGQPVLLSGAGPTLFVLYPSRTAAERAGRVVRDRRHAGSLGLEAGRRLRLIATTLERRTARGRTP